MIIYYCDYKCTVFLSARSCAVINQVIPLFLNFGPFSHSTNLLLFVILLAVSPAISRSVFLFEILRVFLRFSRFYKILFLSSKVKNHICILWNPNICFNNIYIYIYIYIYMKCDTEQTMKLE